MMDSLSQKIQELKKDVSELQKKLEEYQAKSKELDLEISQVKFMKGKANCFLNDEKRIIDSSRIDLKNIHEAYQKLSITQSLEYEILNRREELLHEKEQLESQLGHIKLKRGVEKEKLEEIRTQVMIQKSKKKALMLKLENNCKKSEEARQQAMMKLMDLKSRNRI